MSPISGAASPTRAEAVEACRAALAAYAAGATDAADAVDASDARAFDRVADAIHVLAAIARAERLTPEQMLIELKTVLGDAPSSRAITPAVAESVRARLITAAIRAYFGAPRMSQPS